MAAGWKLPTPRAGDNSELLKAGRARAAALPPSPDSYAEANKRAQAELERRLRGPEPTPEQIKLREEQREYSRRWTYAVTRGFVRKAREGPATLPEPPAEHTVS